MRVGLYEQHLGGLHKGYLGKYQQILDFNGIECIWLEASRPAFWDEVANLDLFIYQWEHYHRPKQIAEALIPVIQYEMKIPCFPNWETCWHYDDKIKQYYLLKQHGFPIIDSYIFWDKREALNWLKSAKMPVVFKLKGGAGASNVILVEQKSRANQLISRMFSRGMKPGRVLDKQSLHRKYSNPYKTFRRFVGNALRKLRNEYDSIFWNIDKYYVLFQKFLPNNSFDTRVSVIGDRAFAFRRMNRKNDFRASGSGNIDYNVDKIDHRAIEIAFTISNKLSFQSMSYDFLFNEANDLEICEISYTYVDTAVYDCPGFWDTNLKWHEGHFWPQYCQLADVLKLPGLKQGEIIK